MAIWNAIGTGLGTIGKGLATGAKTVGSGLATGAKTLGGGLKTGVKSVGSGLSKVPTQYQFDNLSTLGSSTIPTQYQFDNLDKPLFGDFDLGGKNAGKNTFPTTQTTASEDFIKALSEQPTTQKSSGGSGYMPSGYDYEFTPSMVDYSQFMGLSPETQRYLYGGM